MALQYGALAVLPTMVGCWRSRSRSPHTISVGCRCQPCRQF